MDKFTNAFRALRKHRGGVVVGRDFTVLALRPRSSAWDREDTDVLRNTAKRAVVRRRLKAALGEEVAGAGVGKHRPGREYFGRGGQILDA